MMCVESMKPEDYYYVPHRIRVESEQSLHITVTQRDTVSYQEIDNRVDNSRLRSRSDLNVNHREPKSLLVTGHRATQKPRGLECQHVQF